MDETIFMTGPPMATVLATSVHPAAGLVAAIVAGLLGTVAFCSLRRTEPPVHPHVSDTGARIAMPWGLLVPVVLISFALGGVFGSTEVVTVAFADGLGEKAIAGVLLALWAFGSLVAGILTGAVRWRVSAATRMRWGVVALTALMAPTPLIGSAPAMGALLFLAGFAIAPTLIAAVSSIEQMVPPSRAHRGHRDHAHRDRRRPRAGRGPRRGRGRRPRRARGVPRPAGAPGCLGVRWPPRRPAGARSLGSPREHWQNWSGLESAEPTREATPASADEVVAAVTAARGDAVDGQDGRHRPQLHRHLRTRAT